MPISCKIHPQAPVFGIAAANAAAGGPDPIRKAPKRIHAAGQQAQHMFLETPAQAYTEKHRVDLEGAQIGGTGIHVGTDIDLFQVEVQI